MAIDYFCGFESGNGAEIATSVGASITYSAITKKTGGYAIRMNANNVANYFTLGSASIKRGTVYIYFAALPSAMCTIIGVVSALSIRVDTDGTIKAYEGAVLKGTSASTLSATTWYRISFAILSTTTVKVFINGVEAISFATATIGGISDYWGVTEAVVWDLYMDDVACDGTSSTTDLGDIRVLLSNLTGAGTYAQFDTTVGSATHYENVDDAPLATYDNDYNWDSTNTVKRESYPIQSCATVGIGASDTIDSVKILVRMKRGASTTGSNGIMVIDSGTNYDTVKTLTTAFLWYNKIYNTMPNGGAAWTQARVNALEIGVAQSVLGTREPYASVVWAMIAFIPAVVSGWTHIAKVGGVGQAAIGKVNGVSKAAIAKINGVAV